MTRLTPTTIERAIDATKRDQHLLLAITQFPNPKDEFLATVLCKNNFANVSSENYVVWTFNAFDLGFHNGHYFRTREQAYEYYVNALNNAERYSTVREARPWKD